MSQFVLGASDDDGFKNMDREFYTQQTQKANPVTFHGGTPVNVWAPAVVNVRGVRVEIMSIEMGAMV